MFVLKARKESIRQRLTLRSETPDLDKYLVERLDGPDAEIDVAGDRTPVRDFYTRSEREPVGRADLANMTIAAKWACLLPSTEMESLSQIRIFGPKLFGKPVSQAAIFFFELQKLRNAVDRTHRGGPCSICRRARAHERLAFFRTCSGDRAGFAAASRFSSYRIGADLRRIHLPGGFDGSRLSLFSFSSGMRSPL
ncbi:hypothetical protein [Neorhizobium vignae]|uniref:hypothetical protein n=1 Tax=Neorhizobium vignae TaxID=690585 RepID=UPI0005677AD8|nr:hypothetical protein [Neorhizobium vignae]